MPETQKDYVTAVGRRKTASARVKLERADATSVTVNGKEARDYFKTAERESVTGDAFRAGDWKSNYAVTARVSGGGVAAQAVAVRHAIARALTIAEEGSRGELKAAGFLTRDPRAKERKKPGLLKARKRKQWSKR